MDTITPEDEYRKFADACHYAPMPYEEYVAYKVRSGAWVEDDGDYYLPEVWNAQYDEPQDAVDSFRSWLDEEEPEDTDCHCGHPECGAC
jgi:hypothetical protein